MRLRETIAVSLCLVLVAGCSPGGETQINQSVLGSLAPYHRLAIDVHWTTADNPGEEVLGQLTGALVARLRKSGKFDKVFSLAATTETQFDLKLSVAVTALRKIGVNDRATVGFIAGIGGSALMGPGRIAADVTLVDAKTNQPLGAAQMKGNSSAAQGTTSEAVEQIVEQIGSFIDNAKR